MYKYLYFFQFNRHTLVYIHVKILILYVDITKTCNVRYPLPYLVVDVAYTTLSLYCYLFYDKTQIKEILKMHTRFR